MSPPPQATPPGPTPPGPTPPGPTPPGHASLERRPLGRWGPLVAPLGLGTVKLGRTTGLKYAASPQLPTDEQARTLLLTAADLGLNLIDTAPAYGLAEQRLGHLLNLRQPTDRARWVICTKVGETHDDGVSTFDFSPEAVAASCERSLRRLGTDHVDALLVHSDGDAELRLDQLGTVHALQRLRERGLARLIGVSSKSAEGATLAMRWADVLMLTLNRAEQHELPTIAAARDRGIGVLIKKALASGRDAGHDAIAFALAPPGVSAVIVGTSSPAHLRDNALAASRAHPPATITSP